MTPTTATRSTPRPDTALDCGALDVTRLAEALVTDGVPAHDGALCALALAAREAGLPAAVVDALADAGTPDVVRLRAFAVAARRLG